MLDARQLTVRRRVSLPGWFTVDAISPDGRSVYLIQYGDNEVGEVIEALGGSPDIVYECVGSEGMLTKAVMHVRAYGRIVSLGFCTHMDPVMPAMASYKCATMQFLVGYTMRDFLYIADQLDKGHADPKAIISSTVPLVDMAATFESLHGPNNETKVHVTCCDH